MTDVVSDAARERLTDRPRIAHLATTHDDRPHCAPIWFTYRNDHLEATITGRKLRDVHQNPRVALSLQEDHDGHARWGMTIHGTAEIVDDHDEATAILERINARYDAPPDAYSDNTPIRVRIGDCTYWTY